MAKKTVKATRPGRAVRRPDAADVIGRLAATFPGATTELHFSTAFELLVATVLSAQSSDVRVNLTTPALFARYPDARALAAADSAELEQLIVPTGFFRQKARAVTGLSRRLVDEHDGQVPADLDYLVTLPGVGRKTANVVLGHALGVPGLPVDRHVLRVANRIGLAIGDDPIKVERQLCDQLPPAQWTQASDCLILHGRRVCRPTPLCPRCVVNDVCRYALGSAASPDATRERGPRVTRARFEELVAEAVATIPRRFRERMQNLSIVVEDEPSDDLLDEMDIPEDETLFGLYQGTPLTERDWTYGNALPDRITLYQWPIEDSADDDADVVVAIGETLIHEVGHYFGLSEDEIEAIEAKYWRGEAEDE